MIIITQSFLLYRQMVHLSNDSDEKNAYFLKFVKTCENQKISHFFEKKRKGSG